MMLMLFFFTGQGNNLFNQQQQQPGMNITGQNMNNIQVPSSMGMFNNNQLQPSINQQNNLATSMSDLLNCSTNSAISSSFNTSISQQPNQSSMQNANSLTKQLFGNMPMSMPNDAKARFARQQQFSNLSNQQQVT